MQLLGNFSLSLFYYFCFWTHLVKIIGEKYFFKVKIEVEIEAQNYFTFGYNCTSVLLLKAEII